MNGVQYSVSQIITSTVLSYVRSHFNCTTITGLYLEDGGGSGTALSHWEMKLFGNEYMTGTLLARLLILQLAIM